MSRIAENPDSRESEDRSAPARDDLLEEPPGSVNVGRGCYLSLVTAPLDNAPDPRLAAFASAAAILDWPLPRERDEATCHEAARVGPLLRRGRHRTLDSAGGAHHLHLAPSRAPARRRNAFVRAGRIRSLGTQVRRRTRGARVLRRPQGRRAVDSFRRMPRRDYLA